jgi:O-antigen ligase
MLGILAVQFSPLWVLLGVGSIGIISTILKRPEIGILGLVIISSTIIPEASLPHIPIGIGTVYIPDILIFGLFGLIVARGLRQSGFNVTRTPLDIPLLAFFSFAILSTVVAIFNSSLTFNESLGKIRAVNGYLTFFLVTNLVVEERHLRLLLRGLFLLGAMVALAMLAQYVVGPSKPIIPGRVETLVTEGERLIGIARTIPPGYSLVFLAFTSLTVVLAIDKFKTSTVGDFAQWLCLGVGFILTFKRHLWAGLAMMILLLPIYLGKKLHPERLIRAGVGMLVLLLTFGGVIIAAPDSKVGRLGKAFLERFESLVTESTYINPNSSLRWRDFEYKYAAPQIASHPFLGLGLGAKYRPLVIGRDHKRFDGRTFIHNGHISILLQTGVLGYLSWLILAVVSVFRGFKYSKHIRDTQLRAWCLGFVLTWVCVILTSVVEPMIIDASWTPLIGIMLGINEVILRWSSENVQLARRIT